MDKTSLGNRMKTYEVVTQSKLLRRTPVVIRIDGKAFHTWTKRITREVDPSLVDTPFSIRMHQLMMDTAQCLCSQMQNAVFAYTQSDEISILLRDWDKHETEQWFDAKIQKIASVSASMATAYFNHFATPQLSPEWIGDLALFDSRVFNLPMEEVTNYFIWRQQDATRNSIQMLGRHFFSHKQMHGKSTSNVQDMLMELDPPVNWNDIPTWMKRGACVVPNPNPYDSSAVVIQDDEIPIFTKDREYIEQRLSPDVDLFAELPQGEVIKKGGPYDHIIDEMKRY